MTGRGESAWADRDPAALTLQFVSDGTFQITGYVHSYRRMKRGREEGWGWGGVVGWGRMGRMGASEMALRGALFIFFPLSLIFPLFKLS